MFPVASRWLALALVTLLLAACGGSDDPSDQAGAPQDPAVCSTDEPVAQQDLALLPEGLPLDEWGTVVKVAEKLGYVGAEAISELTIVELYPEIARAVRAGDYATISGENEGFEAEIFFQKGDDLGTFLLRKGPCKGQVRIKLIYGHAPEKGKG